VLQPERTGHLSCHILWGVALSSQFDAVVIVAIGKPEWQLRNASQCVSKQQ